MALRNVLLISYAFPPIGGSGVQRAVKLARYLPEAGWRAHVLCAGHARHPLTDPTLERELDDRMRVHRALGAEPAALAAVLTRALRVRPKSPVAQASRLCRHRRDGGATRVLGRTLRRPGAASNRLRAMEDRLYWRLDGFCDRLPLPETELLWVPFAVRAARRLIRRHQIEAVVTTSPPHSTQLVGLALKRRLGLPWIADLRDPVLDNFAYDPRSRIADRFWRWLEAAVLHGADHVVATCPEWVDRLRDRYPRVGAARFTTITNGFDPADAPAPPPDCCGERFTLTYVGAFYRAQSIGPVLDALRGLRQARPDIARLLSFRVVGSIAASQRPLLRDEDTAFFHHVGYRPHDQAVAEMARASALLLMTPANDGGRLCIPGKTFEYLAFGRHIIAVVHAGTALADTLTEAGNVSLLHAWKPGALAAGIERCFDAWRAGSLERPRKRAVVERFRRDRLARRYARLIEHCTDGTPNLHLDAAGLTAEEAA